MNWSDSVYLRWDSIIIPSMPLRCFFRIEILINIVTHSIQEWKMHPSIGSRHAKYLCIFYFFFLFVVNVWARFKLHLERLRLMQSKLDKRLSNKKVCVCWHAFSFVRIFILFHFPSRFIGCAVEAWNRTKDYRNEEKRAHAKLIVSVWHTLKHHERVFKPPKRSCGRRRRGIKRWRRQKQQQQQQTNASLWVLRKFLFHTSVSLNAFSSIICLFCIYCHYLLLNGH